MWFTWANLLTVLRLAAVGPCAWAVLTGHWQLAAGLFLLAVVTDLADGPIVITSYSIHYTKLYDGWPLRKLCAGDQQKEVP